MAAAHTEPHAPVLQGLWESVRAAHEEVLLSSYLPASYGFLLHVLLSAPFLALDALCGVSRRVRSWRIASGSGSQPSPRRWMECFRRLLCRYLTTVLPATAVIQSLRTAALPELAPSCWQLFVEVSACLLLFDTVYFIWHLSMHRGTQVIQYVTSIKLEGALLSAQTKERVCWLYRNIHQLHHEHRVPFALAAQDSSAFELLSLLLLAQGSAWLVGCHPLSEAFFHLINSWLAVEDHCGYDLPLALHKLLPCLGGARYHQAHHNFHSGNYAPYFTHWDHLFGTYRAS
ncbi:hypothetical protein L3Q82_006721 [Scortum barcoo]|uniref:Uncharacterized protein n=1 Tax=Scortum barcoo TaxID=214431 RepID=A0ACB8WYR2_9TELE|nr:hypothetical protein L3Q82_006721 [Scortum barcoo]